MSATRRNDHDVTNTVCIAHPRSVERAVCELLRSHDPALDTAPLRAGFELFTRLYTGRLPGYVGCDTNYHDAQHSLDCTLAYARLFDGHERAERPTGRLGLRRGVLGVLIALFHDAGYVRHKSDRATNGAEFTLVHVSRSAAFLREHLPALGFAEEAELAARIVHFTGYEMALDAIDVPARKDRLLGYFLGTADLMAQTADRCYPEKCRDYLYPEFERCGLAGAGRPESGRTPIYRSVEHLLDDTVAFNRRMREERLDGAFEGAHRFYAAHFNGSNPYQDWLDDNLRRVAAVTGGDYRRGLTRRPKAVTREPLRALLRAAA